ncbi:MAG: hypothetical protein HC915_09400 [Anaerolineae bacterium]|nr:hypothetical protein [Anaerolineae bacterium]
MEQNGLPVALHFSTPADLDLPATRRRLGDFQRFHRELDQVKGFPSDLLLNFVGLQEEIGELARALRQAQGTTHESTTRKHIREELADILAYVLKIANYTGVDLEAAYLEKMAANKARVWDNGG